MTTFFKLMALLLMAAAIASAQVSIHYPGYTLSAAAVLSGNPDAGIIPFAAGKLDKLPAKNPDSRFGILYSDNAQSLPSTTLMEIFDAATNAVIKKVTLDEYYGNESLTWNNGDMKLTREVQLVESANLPAGKQIRIDFKLESAKAFKVYAKFYGKAEGLFKSSGRTFSISNIDPLTTDRPALIVAVEQARQITVEPFKKGKPQSFTITTSALQVEQNHAVSLFTLDVVGTSVPFPGSVGRQAVNLQAYLTTHKAAAKIAVETVPDKQKTMPGDTLTYKIYYDNIGTDDAANMSVSGPIPEGTTYIEGSAAGEGTKISFERKKAAAPQTGAVININWIDQRLLKPGEERWVEYKVVTR
ncbi:MAG: DUF11 domain-containing protein [Bacteroidota bacterium]